MSGSAITTAVSGPFAESSVKRGLCAYSWTLYAKVKGHAKSNGSRVKGAISRMPVERLGEGTMMIGNKITKCTDFRIGD